MAAPHLRSELFRSPQPVPRTRTDDKYSESTSFSAIFLGSLLVAVVSCGCIYFCNYTRSTHAPAACRTDGGLPDYASFANGARVIHAFSSATIPVQDPELYSTKVAYYEAQQLVRSSPGPPSIPEVALSLYSDPRALWFFNGTEGTLALSTSSPVVVQTIRFHQHPTPRACLPRNVTVWGLVVPPNAGMLTLDVVEHTKTPLPVLLEAFPKYGSKYNLFPIGAAPMAQWVPLAEIQDLQSHQTIFAAAKGLVFKRIPVDAVALHFVENGGDRYTCFAAFSIYGSPA